MNANPYQYQRLTFQDSIRLLELDKGLPGSPVSGSLRETRLPEDLDSSPEYTALSYTWGSPEDVCPQPIWIDGQPMQVRNNLMAALQALRHHDESMTLWIDAICINQCDIPEKNHQVASMARIYRAAEAVKIWLGPDGEGSAMAMAYVRDMSRTLTRSTTSSSYSSSPVQDPPLPSDATVGAFHALMARSYWTRAWIIQEVILGKEIDLHCGPRVVEWETMVEAYKSLPHSSGSSSQSQRASPARNLMLRRETAMQPDRPLQEQTLERLIRVHQHSECADRRDRVFALLSLAVDCASGQGIVADYAMARFELLVQVLMFCKPQNDVLDFITLLWRLLLRDKEDGQWERALDFWQEEMGAARDTTESHGSHVTGKVRVAQFVAAKSASTDWVRCSTVECRLSYEFRGGNRSRLPRSHTDAFHRQAHGVARRFEDAVDVIDEHNVAVSLSPTHAAVFTTNAVKATTSACMALRLHEPSAGCTWGACALLRQELWSEPR